MGSQTEAKKRSSQGERRGRRMKEDGAVKMVGEEEVLRKGRGRDREGPRY